MTLTYAQEDLLEKVRRDGVRIFNGRARKTIEALEKAGLVTVEWDLDIRAGGSSAWRITVRPKPTENNQL